eukprot:CAMPEP_0172519828 /NCGR_PEP_ID=MMETSP1066-20121228/291647_1 /TAXON_ID=671091 /ORGANISM="Coscinodiscus wailesii, Strain CCMP2513" /LENGTH=812 /DNA_ID=CAMNT_0013302487 /DNA_START=152 /DNA_END=2590 /DNA_ORIENTATION=+
MGNSSSAASLPYTIEPTPLHKLSNQWQLHEGRRKSDSSPVSVFKLSKSSLLSTTGLPQVPHGENLLHAALHHFRKSKTLVHPQILRVEATLDTDDPDGTKSAAAGGGAASTGGMATGAGDLIIVTEPVMPLLAYLEDGGPGGAAGATAPQQLSQDGLAWGLHNLIHALSFLHNNAKLSHGNLCLGSVYVTPGGDFKLGNFSLLSGIPLQQHFRDCDADVCPHDYRSPERLKRDYDAVADCAPHVLDSYGLGILIEEMFRMPLAGGRVPNKLTKAIARLKTPNVKMRPRVLPLLRCPIFDVALVKFMETMDGLAAKPVEEKISFFQGVPDLLQRGVVDVRTAGRYKLLPELVRSVETICAGGPQALAQDVNRREIMVVIPPLFLIVEYLTSSDEQGNIEFFQSQVIPLLITLFTINDRGVRGALLARLPSLTPHIPVATLNAQIFEPMCSGFSDTSAPLRELTLKSTLALVPHLNSTSLEKMTRYLIRLQGDNEASIRTNTIIFVGKVVGVLGDNQRQRLILPAFTRAMKDEFTPCRLAALKAVLQCKDYFDPRNLAKDVLPLVCPHLMDNVGEVRVEAMRVVEDFVLVLKEECERMSAEEGGSMAHLETTTTDNTSTPIAPAPSSGGWAMSGLGSWAMGGIMSTTKADADSGPTTTSTSAADTMPETTTTAIPTQPQAADNDGWSDDDHDDDNDNFGNNSTPVPPPSWMENPEAKKNTLTNKVPGFSSPSSTEDDFFSSFDKPAVTATAKIGGVGKTSSSGAKGRLVVPTPAAGSASSSASKKTLAERRAEFEKRKALRQQQLQAQKEGKAK